MANRRTPEVNMKAVSFQARSVPAKKPNPPLWAGWAGNLQL
jgi:hypothetical protein